MSQRRFQMWSESSYSTDILFACKRKRKPRFMISGYNPLCCSQFSAETCSVSVVRWAFSITIYNSLSKHKVIGNPTLPRNFNYRGFTSVDFPAATLEPSRKFPSAEKRPTAGIPRESRDRVTRQ